MTPLGLEETFHIRATRCGSDFLLCFIFLKQEVCKKGKLEAVLDT